MAARVGITTDFLTRKWELEQEYKNTRSWKTTDPLKDKKEALAWEKKKSEEFKCKTVDPDFRSKNIRIIWQGFYFEHDGPK